MHANSIKNRVQLCVRTPIIIQFGVSPLGEGVGAKSSPACLGQALMFGARLKNEKAKYSWICGSTML